MYCTDTSMASYSILHLRLTLISITFSTDEVIDPTEEDILDLDPNDSVFHDPPISPEDKMMAGEFCFTQTDDGKIVEVSYPDGESSEAVNFKKGIVAAFQTNFKGTAEQEEEDTTSFHKSAYRCDSVQYTLKFGDIIPPPIGILQEVQRSQRIAQCKAPMCTP